MFKLNERLTAHAVKHWGLDAELAKDIAANEDAIKSHLTKGLDAGDIKFSEVEALLKEPDQPKGVDLVKSAVSEAIAPLTSALGDFTKALKESGAGGDGASVTDPEPTPDGTKELGDGKGDEPAAGAGKKAYSAAGKGGQPAPTDDDYNVRVKSIKERFGTEKSFVPGQEKSLHVPSMEKGVSHSFDGVSELEKAVAGSTLKWLMNRAEKSGQGRCPQWAKMTELDHKLMEYAAHEMNWMGPVGMKEADGESADYGWAKNSRLNDIQTKAVLDDATSGGLEAVPIVFDDLAVLTPLLVGQLLPLVDQRVTTRRRVEGFRLGNPEMYWTAEGTTPTEFDTAAFISEFNTNIHPCVGWMEIGLDMEADSPVAIADMIISRYALKASQKLENAIANGSGTGEPLGLLNTPSPVSVSSANGGTGPAVVGDYEGAYFGVPLEFRQEAGNRLVFVSNDVTYQRATGIEVGASDQRRVFGMNHQSYRLLNVDNKINHGLGNGVLMAACMNRYILYRRAGFDVRRVTEDADLAKQNKELLVVRMRYGGQLNHASALALISDMQS